MASAIYAVAISQAAASDTWSTWSSIVSNTQIKLTNNYGPGSWWLVIGKQQWGRTGTVNGDTSKTITYPIAYSSAFFSIALVSTDNSSDWNTEISGTPGTSSATIIVRGKQRANVYWICIGK